MAVIFEKALPDVEHITVDTSDEHSVAFFELNGVGYYADILNDWQSLDELDELMVIPVYFLSVEGREGYVFRYDGEEGFNGQSEKAL